MIEKPIIGFDTETHLMGAGNLAPRLVCLSVGNADEGYVCGRADGSALDETLDTTILTEESLKVGCFIAYDLAVIANYRQELFPAIFNLLSKGLFADILVREKLLDLTEHGDLKFMLLPGGFKKAIEYKMSALVERYFGNNISASKDDDDAWRLHYSHLEAIPTDQWPAEAYEYACDDAKWPVKVYMAQEERRQRILQERGIDALATEVFRTCVDFALHLMSCNGVMLDIKRAEEVEQMLIRELAPEKTQLLVDSGILRPGTPAKPQARGVKSHVEGCKKEWKENGKTVKCNCPPKMSAAVKESVNKKKLQAHVLSLAKTFPEIQLKYTDASERFPEGQLQVNGEFLDDYWHLDPILEQYRNRQALQKLVTTELPRMRWLDGEGNRTVFSPIVHPSFDVLKETGRCSSYGSSKYPSFNCQNVDPRARQCYVPRPGYAMMSCDYSSMELVSAAQKMIELFGKSVMADKLNAGYDLHAYLGSQLSFALDADFRASCLDSKVTTPDEIYQVFLSCKKSEIKEIKELYKHYRTFAKPTGLGYPGGLGPATFVKYAKATYGVIVDKDTASDLRDIWKLTYPEMVQYFEWINTQCEDVHHQGRVHKDKKTGEERIVKTYAYSSPMGMYRANCDYCAAANGAALQTPSAEGALMGVWNLVRACYDKTMNSCLYPDEKGPTYIPTMFIHDENIGDNRIDEGMQARADEVARIMMDSFNVVTPDVHIKTQPVLMSRWNKNAKAVFDKDGKLMVWTDPDEVKRYEGKKWWYHPESDCVVLLSPTEISVPEADQLMELGDATTDDEAEGLMLLEEARTKQEEATALK